jgi:2-phospho-L-lactate/phosphoenolpyruvate guanylyltransferase
MDIWALIPVKSLKDSKLRLAHLLPADQRAILIHGLLQHELMVLEEVPTISKVLVISSDPAVWRLAWQFGVLIEKEPEPQGLNTAVTRGMAKAVENGASGVLMLPVDLPFITTSDVALIIDAGLRDDSLLPPKQQDNGSHGENRSGCVMAICSDEDGDGTNSLFLNPVSEFQFHFGPGSYQLHVREAQKRGITVHTVSTPGLQFDLDSEKDWLAYQQLVSMPNM